LHTKVSIKHSVEMTAVKAMQELHTPSLEKHLFRHTHTSSLCSSLPCCCLYQLGLYKLLAAG